MDSKDAQRISVDQNGRVSFNTNGLNLTGNNADAAVVLLNNMINGPDKFLMEVVPKGQLTSGLLRSASPKGPAGKPILTDLNDKSYINPLSITTSGILNLSKTPRNHNGGSGNAGLLPKNGYDGQTSLGPGHWTFANGQKQPTSNIVFHELSEIYHRTVNKLPYHLPNGIGAHKRAIIDAQNFSKQGGKGWIWNLCT